jgi:hypothetical protein
MAKSSVVEITADASELLALIHRLNLALEVGQSALSAVDCPDELVSLKLDSDPAAAHKLLVRLEPSDALRSLAFALGAGDVDGLAIKQSGHGVTSSGD